MIHESVMAAGSFEVPLSQSAPWGLWDRCEEFGHIVVLAQWLDPGGMTDAGMLAISRYTGVLLKKTLDDNRLALEGAGIHWHLGDDDGSGPIIEGTTIFSADSLTDVVTAALTDTGLTSGTVNTSGLGTYTGYHYFDTPAQMLRTACLALGAEYRVNPDGTVDAGAKNNVYRIDSDDIRVVMVRKGWGTDSLYQSVPVNSMRSSRDATHYVTRVILTQDSGNDGELTEVDSLSRSPTPSYKNLAGNTLKRAYMQNSGVTGAIDAGLWATSELAQRSIIAQQDVSTEHYEIAEGSLAVGDAFYAYDPPAFIDPNNPQYFRGETIFPISTRLLQADWPLRRGMGVYYRSADGEYIDMTRWVAWEGDPE